MHGGREKSLPHFIFYIYFTDYLQFFIDKDWKNIYYLLNYVNIYYLTFVIEYL